MLIDDGATTEQRDALVEVFSGQLGGPLADFAQLIGTVKGSSASPSATRSRAEPGRSTSPASSKPRWSPTGA